MNKTDRTAPEATPAKTNNVVPMPASMVDQRPSDKVIAFVKRHPALTIVGALAAGAAISAMLPRGRRVMGKALRVAEAAGAATAVFGKEAGEKAQTEVKHMSRGARKEASRLAHRAEKAGDRTVLALEKYGLAALSAASALGRSAAQHATDAGEAAADTAHRVRDAAVAQSHKVKDRAEALVDRARH